jgi:hypothetical protein
VDSKDDENDNPEILSLKLETLAGIKERYPEYRTECTRQEDWLRGASDGARLFAGEVFESEPGNGLDRALARSYRSERRRDV